MTFFEKLTFCSGGNLISRLKNSYVFLNLLIKFLEDAFYGFLQQVIE